MRNCVEKWKPIAAMVAVEPAFALMHILFKKGLNGGIDQLVILVYRQSISTVFLIPFVYFLERGSWTKLTCRVTGQLFLCALLGLTLAQYLFLIGLDYTSATFTCAFINMVPVITFALALPLRMEKLNMKSRRGKAKVLGTLICSVGALILSLYKGMIVINSNHATLISNPKRPKHYGLGSAFLTAGCLAWSSWFLIQSRIGQNFPYGYSSTCFMSLFSAIQSGVVCFITDRKVSKWILKGELQILIVIYAGIVGSGVGYVIMSWCVKKKGPVFTSAFGPLIQFFAAIFDVTILHEEIYLGSILGSLVVIVGMYVLLWGKSNDDEITTNQLPKTIDGYNGQDQGNDFTAQ